MLQDVAIVGTNLENLEAICASLEYRKLLKYSVFLHDVPYKCLVKMKD